MIKIELIQGLIRQAQELPFREKDSLNALLEEADTVLKSFYGNTANYRAELKMIRFSPWSFQSGENEFKTSWNSGKNALINLLETILNDPAVIVPPLEIPKIVIPPPPPAPELPVVSLPKKKKSRKSPKPEEKFKSKIPAKPKIQPSLMSSIKSLFQDETNAESETVIPESAPLALDGIKKTDLPRESRVPPRIFLVHGAGTDMKKTVSDVLIQFELKPILTREEPNIQKTMMQKLTEYPDINCAVVILSADDFAYEKSAKPKDAKLRAFQGVVFEMGIFIGKFGRNKVIILHPEKSNFELPSTYFDAVYIPFDKEYKWKIELAEKLKFCGFQINLNSLKS